MKKILKYFTLVSLSVLALSACNREEAYDTDQYGTGVAFSAMAPNPVMRGGELRILGNNLDQVASVKFAGDISVTDITVVKAGAHGEIRVLVPMEGPEVGKVSIVTKDGKTYSSFADLEYTEPIEIDSFSPATVLSGDVVTITGEYLNNVQMVFFPGEDVATTEFVSQSRYELKVEVPFNAITGPIILSDVNEWADQSTIPNHIYTATDLVVGDPTVDEAEETTYKAGDLVTVTGAHLDMIKNVALAQVNEVDFTVADDAASLSFNMPAAATDGTIILTSYAGVTFDAGDYKTVTVSDLAIESQAEDGRYKAGNTVKISGEDLDLVTKVEFTGAEASWYYESGDIYATVPDAAKDGVVTLTLESGKQAFTEEITVVKPVVAAVDKTEAVAGKDQVVVSGTDLDLVTGAKMGTKENTFIDCEFTFNQEDGTLAVSIPSNAYTGIITLSAANGTEVTTDEITVTYEELINVVIETNPLELGGKVVLTGEGLSSVETINIVRGKNIFKVLNYLVRSDNRYEFALPEELGPGVYRLEFTLVDGTQITWPVPFTVTASYEKRILWEGSKQITWGDGGRVIISAADLADVPAGTLLYLCYTQKDQTWAQAQINYGDWSGINFNEGEIQFNQTLVPTDIYGWFSDGILDRVTPVVLTAEILANIQAKQGSCEDVTDAGIIIQGSDLTFTEIYVNLPTAGEKVVWEGETAITWGDGGRVIIPATEFEGVKAGSTLALYYTQKDQTWAQAQINYGNWSGINFNEGEIQFNQTLVPTDIYGWFTDGVLDRCTEVVLTAEILANIQANQGSCEDVTNAGIIIQGSDLTFTKVSVK